MPEIKKAPLYEMGFNEDDEFNTGITAIGVVTDPAIMKDFFAFSNQKPEEKVREYKFVQAAGEAKKMLVGPAMIPKLPIYRNDEEHGEYYVFASEDTIKKLSYSFIKNGRQNNATIEHMTMADGMHIVETWIVEDPKKDKSNAYGMEHPKGTWMIAMQVRNQAIWDNFIATGELKGFSIEGLLWNKLKSGGEDEKPKGREDFGKANKRIESAVRAVAKVMNSKNYRNDKGMFV